MTRRNYLKGILFFGATSAISFSVFKWFQINEPVYPEQWIAKREIIAELAELIIPSTDTPGAKAAGVHDFIINIIINCTPVREQERFYMGLEALENYAIDRYGKEFLKCNTIEMNNILEHLARTAQSSNRIINKINNKFFGHPFYFTLKDLTVEGYCVSKLGATKGLAYDYIPVTYEACIPMQKNQKSWATK